MGLKDPSPAIHIFQCPLLELVARSRDCPSKVKGVVLKMSLQNTVTADCVPFLLSGLLCWKLAAMIGFP